MKLKLVPSRKVPLKVLKKLKGGIKKTFDPAIEEIKTIYGTEINKYAYDPDRGQYRAERVLENIRKAKLVEEEGKALAVTSEDLYSEKLNFVFGQAHAPCGIAVISLYRLRPEFYGNGQNERVLFERARKEATHEIGHTFRLKHCEDSRCVMSFSNSIVDVDAKTPSFCKACRKKLEEDPSNP